MSAATPLARGFAINRTPGFTIAFESGWKISVAWGPGTYSQNREWSVPELCAESTSAEVLIWHGDRESDFNEGWLRPEKVAELIAEVAARPPPASRPD